MREEFIIGKLIAVATNILEFVLAMFFVTVNNVKEFRKALPKYSSLFSLKKEIKKEVKVFLTLSRVFGGEWA